MARSAASLNATKRTPKAVATSCRQDEEAASMASYIADMSSELSQLALSSELQMVAYFLNLARVEAEIRARELGGYPIEREETRQSGL